MADEDDRSVRLLRHCHRAMAEHGRVLIIQQGMPPPGSDVSPAVQCEGTLSELNMFVLVGGDERTEAEYRTLLAAAGFTLTNVVPTQALMSIVEGTRA